MEQRRLKCLSLGPIFFLILISSAHSIQFDSDNRFTDKVIIISEPTPEIFNHNYAHTLGTCGATMLCPNASCSMLTSQGTNPEIVESPLGSESSYVMENLKIDSPLHIVFRNDNYFTGTGLDLNRTKEAISLAAQTWSYDANQNMFYYTVSTDPNAAATIGKCLIQFSPTVEGLGLTTIWIDGSREVINATMILSTNYPWTTNYTVATTTNVVDLQSVVLHELGHITGLGDLYDLPDGDPRKTDYDQIMNLYRGGHPRHNAGKGDVTGIQSIYGCGTIPTTTSSTTTTSTTSTTSITTTTTLTTTTSTSTTIPATSTSSTTSSTSTTSILSSTTTIPSTTTTIPVNATTTTIPGNTTTSTTTTSIISTTTIPANSSTTTSTTSTTTTVGSCSLVGDYPPCGEISLSEVVDLIT